MALTPCDQSVCEGEVRQYVYAMMALGLLGCEIQPELLNALGEPVGPTARSPGPPDCPIDNRVIFVAVGADGDGTLGAPMGSIQAAIEQLAQTGGGSVFAQGGIYEGIVTMPNGVRVIGGFNALWQPGVEATTIHGALDDAGRAVAVLAKDIQCAQLDRLTITTPAASFGQSSYGVVARRAPGLRLFDVTIRPGAGGDGVPGLAGEAGQPGGDGGDAVLEQVNGCWHRLQPGEAGENPACPDANGGDGDTLAEGELFSRKETPLGECQANADADACAAIFSVDGMPGITPSPRFDSPLEDGWWRTHNGGPGQPGQHGEGGAGALDIFNAWRAWPRAASGGGAGGCGGRGGRAGTGAGSAFGLFAVDSAGLRVRRSDISGGRAGLGGRGGLGGLGGPAGASARGWICDADNACDRQSCEFEYGYNDGRIGGRGGRGGAGSSGISVGARCWNGALDIDAATRLGAGSAKLKAEQFGCCADVEAQQACVQGGAEWDANRCVCRAACVGGSEVCDGRDNDCDGVVDETHLNPERPVVRSQNSPFDFSAWGERLVLVTAPTRHHHVIELTAAGDFVRGHTLRVLESEWTNWFKTASGPSGTALQIDDDADQRIRYTLTYAGAHDARYEFDITHYSAHTQRDGQIDIIGMGSDIAGPHQRTSWTRLNPQLVEDSHVSVRIPSDVALNIVTSTVIDDRAHFLAIEPPGLRWVRTTPDGVFDLQRVAHPHAIDDLHGTGLPDGTLGVVFNETTPDGRRGTLARLTAEGLQVIVHFEAGQTFSLLRDGDATIIARQIGDRVVAVRVGPDGMGTSRQLAVLPNAHHLQLLAVGDSHVLTYARQGHIYLRQGALCLPSAPDSDGDGLSDIEEARHYATDPAEPDSDGDGCLDGFEVQHQLDPNTPDLLTDSDDDGRSNGSECVVGTDPFNPDTDEDGLSDGDEHVIGSDPFLSDSDLDGLLDGDEVHIHGSDPTNADTDADRLPDNLELTEHGTSPLLADTDGDGILDSAEIWSGLDPLTPNEGDLDADGLADVDEFSWGTDPLNPDSDDDGLMDGGEVAAGTDPTNRDTDGDSLLDGREALYGTDPLNPDTDGDGWQDGYEASYRSDPLVVDGPDADNDGDGLTNAEEIRLGLALNEPDLDHDGLQDGAEIDRGTNPRNPDTDNDALLDGAEVHEHGTDPLRADTDGGGATDEIEVRAGTDPLVAADDPRFAAEVCPDETFSCGEGICLINALRCDFIVDCPDGADENNCETCPEDGFLCAHNASEPALNGPPIDWRLRRAFCLPDERRCNRVADCRGAVDEIGCVCGPDEFNCGGPNQDGPCIPDWAQWDGECDCPEVDHCADER